MSIAEPLKIVTWRRVLGFWSAIAGGSLGLVECRGTTGERWLAFDQLDNRRSRVAPGGRRPVRSDGSPIELCMGGLTSSFQVKPR